MRKVLRLLPVANRGVPLRRWPLLLRSLPRGLRLQASKLNHTAAASVWVGLDPPDLSPQITTASLYSPYTFRMASEISPTVALASTAASIRGMRLSPERAVSSTARSAAFQVSALRFAR